MAHTTSPPVPMSGQVLAELHAVNASHGLQFIRAATVNIATHSAESLGCRSPNVMLVSPARRDHFQSDENVASSADSATSAGQKAEKIRTAGDSER